MAVAVGEVAAKMEVDGRGVRATTSTGSIDNEKVKSGSVDQSPEPVFGNRHRNASETQSTAQPGLSPVMRPAVHTVDIWSRHA